MLWLLEKQELSGWDMGAPCSTPKSLPIKVLVSCPHPGLTLRDPGAFQGKKFPSFLQEPLTQREDKESVSGFRSTKLRQKWCVCHLHAGFCFIPLKLKISIILTFSLPQTHDRTRTQSEHVGASRVPTTDRLHGAVPHAGRADRGPTHAEAHCAGLVWDAVTEISHQQIQQRPEWKINLMLG